MSQEFSLSKEDMATLDRIDAELSGATASTSGAEAVALDLGELCKIYHAIREALKLLIKIVKKIPGIGPKIARALEFLMSLADIACPV